MKKLLKEGTNLAPVPVAMVSCQGEDKANIITIAWTGVLNSEPPLVYISIRPTRHSYNIIKNTKEFVLNIPDDKLVWQADFCGTKSGSKVDKFKEANLTKEEASIVKAPMIKECPISLECKVEEIKHLGSHDMFIARVVATHVEEAYVKENGAIDFESANLLTYAGSCYLCQNKKIADRGICLK